MYVCVNTGMSVLGAAGEGSARARGIVFAGECGGADAFSRVAAGQQTQRAQTDSGIKFKIGARALAASCF